MAQIKEALQRFRERGYSSKSSESRMLELTPDELKLIPKSDEEICLSVYGVLSDGGFKVTRIETESEEEEPPSSVPEGPSNRAMPSPS